ncbi:hypothetical protein JCM14244_13270 [Venenivibrio stagnispumantis]|uniref:TatD DNase family protein n=1 Tax=Venenivibrio stagnispumantis TaxID=407998 RepID=A0AA45WKV6_9AQUI|nr:TatD family hydrolase [Venenivibrio stagnispumantis]MCW4573106.1 TatD family hydrolase [Venenivibrio stagnispumantis]SMP09063.1 TatD DNase family protein [Venenivibrio stagnispumantis]
MTDTHAHLDMVENFEEEISKLNYILTIGCDKEEIHKAIEIAGRYENVYASIGYHPYDINDITLEDVENLKQLINPKVVAIGETGLDYYRDKTPKDKQKLFFEKHIEISIELNLPIVVHSREANIDTMDILEHYKKDKGILHCFGGDKLMLKRALDLGFYISFAGNITYPKADNLREMIKYVPLDRLLLETDSPYLAPQKVRGKPNRPSYIFYTLEFVSNLLNKSPSQIEEITDNNFKRLINQTISI